MNIFSEKYLTYSREKDTLGAREMKKSVKTDVVKKGLSVAKWLTPSGVLGLIVARLEKVKFGDGTLEHPAVGCLQHHGANEIIR